MDIRSRVHKSELLLGALSKNLVVPKQSVQYRIYVNLDLSRLEGQNYPVPNKGYLSDLLKII